MSVFYAQLHCVRTTETDGHVVRQRHYMNDSAKNECWPQTKSKWKHFITRKEQQFIELRWSHRHSEMSCIQNYRIHAIEPSERRTADYLATNNAMTYLFNVSKQRRETNVYIIIELSGLNYGRCARLKRTIRWDSEMKCGRSAQSRD